MTSKQLDYIYNLDSQEYELDSFLRLRSNKKELEFDDY